MSKKVGVQGKMIHSQGRELVNNVANFMKKEAEEGITIPLRNHRERTVAATGISKSTYQRISKEALNVEWSGPSTSFQSPPKKRSKAAPKLDKITIGQIQSIREIIYNFYIYEKRAPTLKCILQKIEDMSILTEKLSVSSLRIFLKNIGFRWQRTQDKRMALMETYDIRLKRINFLKQMKEYREAGRKIIYTDETYIHSSHVKEMGWYDNTCKGLKKPISKGQRLIMVHAGGEDGFIENGLLIFRSGTKSGDYHDEMNHDNFMKWVKNQLLPNLPPNSVLVVDNAAYHNVPSKPNVTSGSLKSEILNWLKEKNLPADPQLTKPELYNIVKSNKFRFPTSYKLDELLQEHGHRVLRLPPYHPELNLIEKIWATVKNWVASRNTTFQLKDVEALARQKFAEVTAEEWNKICKHVQLHELELMKKEHMFDDVQEHLQFRVNTGSSDEFESESEDSDSNGNVSCSDSDE